MKIFMCVNYPIYNPAIGISKKLRTQIDTFGKMGFDVTYSAYEDSGFAIYKNDYKICEKKYSKAIPVKMQTIFRKFYLLNFIQAYLYNSNEQFDLGFIRWSAVDFNFLKTLQCMKKHCKYIIMDCHGYHNNYKDPSIKGRYIAMTTNFNYRELRKYVSLCLTETRNNEIFGIPAIPIDTGINVEDYQPHMYVGNEKDIQMISVANEQSYHGYDRIIRGIHSSKRDNIYLHLVGKISPATKSLIKRLNLQDKVFLYGYKTRAELTNIYNRCNIGVGPLAPNRVGGKEGTGIKTKEYFAIGLPYFFAGNELLVPDNYPYILKFEANETPIDVEKVVSFYNKIKLDLEIQESMRDFARENFSWEKFFIKALSSLGIKYYSI